jgi:cbb3-type cytochrome oxidase cytochrome c subunit
MPSYTYLATKILDRNIMSATSQGTIHSVMPPYTYLVTSILDRLTMFKVLQQMFLYCSKVSFSRLGVKWLVY